MFITYSQEVLPPKNIQSIFLAGPTPRSNFVLSWRPTAIFYLHSISFDGVILSPEFRHGKFTEKIDYKSQIEWEENALNIATCILFWIPRNMETMPALTTNDEWGTWKKSGKVVLGTTKDAVSVNYQKYYAEKYNVPFSTSLLQTTKNALNLCKEKI